MSTGCPCGSCIPRPMLGTSWWKNLGFNEPTECAEGLHKQGFRWFTEWYQEEKE